MSWSTRSIRPDSWELCWTYNDASTVRVGECCWIRLPLHPAVAMQRITDTLNADAATLNQTAGTGPWSWEEIAHHPDQRPKMWIAYHLAGTEAMVLVWDKVPTNPARWHDRIAHALNAFPGLPAVEVTAPTGVCA